MSVEILARVLLQKFVQFRNSSLELISGSELVNDLFDLPFHLRLFLHRLASTELGSCDILSFSSKNDIDPFLNMVVLRPVNFYDLVGLPDGLLPYFN